MRKVKYILSITNLLLVSEQIHFKYNKLIISERTNSIGRFSPLFYGKKDQQLPFTDSDGLYDFPSSDGKGCSSVSHLSKKSSTKRRDRKSSRNGKPQSFHSPSNVLKHKYL